MKINSDINILGGMPDLNLIRVHIPNATPLVGDGSSSTVRTRKSVDRFENAIKATFFEQTDPKVLSLLKSISEAEGISDDCRLVLFWTASTNNDLLDYLNRNVFFPALYSGRTVIKPDEVLAGLKELQETESTLKNWSDYTLKLTASKYLTLLKKFKLVEGSKIKTILHPFLNDKVFILLVYWITAIESQPNILESKWIVYSFYEQDLFIDRIRQNRFSKYLSISFSGDRLKVEPLLDYKDVYYVLNQPESAN